MKKFRLLIPVLVFSFFNQAYGQENKWSMATWPQAVLRVLTGGRLQDRTNVPDDVKNKLVDHCTEVQSISSQFNKNNLKWRLAHILSLCFLPPKPYGGINVITCSWLPGYYIKSDHVRYDNAQKIKQFINDNKLRSVAVAQKYLYLAPGNKFYNLFTNNYLVIAQEVKGKQYSNQGYRDNFGKLKEINNDLNKIIEIHGDLHQENLVFSNDDKTVTIIDTDSYSTKPNHVRSALKVVAAAGLVGGIYYKYTNNRKTA